MAYASSVCNNVGPGNNNHHLTPNPPPRTHPRPNQPPPPPPPLPSVPPVPPTRDSSITLSAMIGAKQSNVLSIPQQTTPMPNVRSQSYSGIQPPQQDTFSSESEVGFLNEFTHLFKPLHDLPPPEPFMNKHKTYPSQKARKNAQSNPSPGSTHPPVAR